MLIFENIKFALAALYLNKIRSALTMLGVIIGVFAVITLISIGEGVRGEFSKQIEDLGTNLVAIIPGEIDLENFNPSQAMGVNTLSLSDIESIKKEVKEVDYIAPLMLISGLPSFEDRVAKQSVIFATTEEIEKISPNFEIKEGRFLEKTDLNEKKKVAVLGSEVKNALFGEGNPLGKKIKAVGQDFEVIGFLKYNESALQLGGTDLNGMINIPLTSAQEITKATQIFRILIRINKPENINPAVEKIKAVMKESHHGANDFTVFTQEDMLDIFDDIFGILTKAISGIAAISLIVGGIGIMNIMLVSVTERTREIGLRKAVGASRGNILFQFLVESAVISILGGVLGVILAILVSIFIENNINIPTQITLRALILAFGISVGVGIIFGLAPAIKAARKNPLEALRYE